jgi:DNA polymerase I-like protein with 3'-5' exonuclease and polymerase domains
VAYIVPTIHPAVLFHSGQQISDVIAADIGKAAQISRDGGFDLPEYIVWPLPGNPEGVQASYEKAVGWMQYWQRTGARLAIDVETSSLNFFGCKLFSIALAEAESSTAVAFTLHDFHTLPAEYEANLCAWLRALLADEGIEKVFHNAPFDMGVLAAKGYNVRGPILDTQGMHHLVQPDIPHRLDWVGQTYLPVGPWKYDHRSGKMANTKDPIELLIYNARDALYTAYLVAPLKRAVEQRGMSAELIYWQSQYAKLATDMEVVGMPVNLALRKQMALEKKNKFEALLYQMRQYLNWSEFNPMSDAHKREVLFGTKYAGAPYNLGLKSSKLTKKTKRPSTSYKAIIDDLEHPFVRMLATYIETRAVYATQYADGTLRQANGKLEKPGSYQRAIYPDGRLHAQWKPNTLNSVRYGSSPNVQNQRKPDRVFFEPAPGRVLVGSDKDQLELRIAACRAGVRELLEEMAKPDGDPHSLAARHVYGQEFIDSEPKKREVLRGMVKNVVYASLYLAGITTVWRTIRERKQLEPALRAMMTKPVVGHIHKSYFMRYMEFPRWHEEDLRFINNYGYIEIPPFGRRRYCPVKPAPATEFSNWKVQCLGAEIVTSEMCTIQDELKKRFDRAYIIRHGHDELNVECWEKDAEDVKKLVESIFGATPLDGPAGRVLLTASATIGKNLKEAK